MRTLNLMVVVFLVSSCSRIPTAKWSISEDRYFTQARDNAAPANEAFERATRYMAAWLEKADPQSGLIPSSIQPGKEKSYWDPHNAAADNYPFLVLTSAMTDRTMLEGRMQTMLQTEQKLTSRLGNIPDTFDFAKQGFLYEQEDVTRIIFGGAEYVKDGLIPITEWLGDSPWSQRMKGIVLDICRNAPFDTKYGAIPSDGHEVNGDLLQVLSRLYWMTGDSEYLDYAIRIGDYYLFDHNPARENAPLLLRDHGGEIVNGLSELYLTVHYIRPEKQEAYRQPLYELYDAILAKGRDEYGLFYGWVNLVTGEHDHQVWDTWGYIYNGFYTVYRVDGVERYRQATVETLSNLKSHYMYPRWPVDSADSYADSIEGALYLYNREPVPSAAEWIDAQIQTMWAKQTESGVIEGWHGDGNFARTSLLYALWKTQGITIDPWRADVRLGAVQVNGKLYIQLASDSEWSGNLRFDRPRHLENMHMPVDYPRINQFPEWFTANSESSYSVIRGDQNPVWQNHYTGGQLQQGIPMDLPPNGRLLIIVE